MHTKHHAFAFKVISKKFLRTTGSRKTLCNLVGLPCTRKRLGTLNSALRQKRTLQLSKFCGNVAMTNSGERWVQCIRMSADWKELVSFCMSCLVSVFSIGLCCLVCLLWCCSQLLLHTAQDQLTVFRALVRRAWLQSLTLLPKKEHLFHFSWAGICSVTFEDVCRPAFRSVRFHHAHWW